MTTHLHQTQHPHLDRNKCNLSNDVYLGTLTSKSFSMNLQTSLQYRNKKAIQDAYNLTVLGLIRDNDLVAQEFGAF